MYLASMEELHKQIILNAFKDAELSEEHAQEFLGLWKPVAISKHTLMTEVGKVERRFYVVIKGVQAVYLLDRKGNKVVIGFSFDGSYSGIYDSFVDREPSGYFLEALTDSELYYISPDEYDALFDKYPGFDRWGRIVHGFLLKGRVQRELEISTLTSEERFKLFMKRCPQQLRQIPQKYLAAYLNMTPETFSRLMNSVTW